MTPGQSPRSASSSTSRFILPGLALLLTLLAALGLTHYFRQDILLQSHLSNTAARCFLSGQPRQTLLLSFTISAQRQLTVIRVSGPRLAKLGVGNPLPRPSLQILRMADRSDLLKSYDTENSYLRHPDMQVFCKEATIPEELPIVMMLESGAYTLVVQSADDRSGEVLAEVTAAKL